MTLFILTEAFQGASTLRQQIMYTEQERLPSWNHNNWAPLIKWEERGGMGREVENSVATLISCYCLLDQEGRGKAEKGGNWLLSASLKPQNMRYLCRWKSICVIYWTYLLERTVKMLTQNLILSVLDTDKRILKGDTKNSDYTEPWGCLPNSLSPYKNLGCAPLNPRLGYANKVLYGRLRLEFHLLTLLHTIFDGKKYPYLRTPTLDKW